MLIIRKSSELTLRSLAICTYATNRSYSKDYASSDDEKDQSKKLKKTNEKRVSAPGEQEESAASRLNRLLASMQTDENYSSIKQEFMARPGEGNQKRKLAAKQEAADKDMFSAVKRVASLMGEDNKKQTESELLAKLLGHNQTDTTTSPIDQTATKDQKNELSLSELIVGMKIDRRQQTGVTTRGEFVRHSIATKKQQFEGKTQRHERKREAETYTGSVNLFGGEPLGIFNQPAQLQESPDMLSTWAHLHRHELKMQVSHPPANYFEKIAKWTEQGKVWRFPINNEQDMHEEAEVDFSEHIFVEQHLEPWCPSKGPIRHFMELVCVGLSKNPYISAKEKKDHILWYRDYFEAKKDVLRNFMNKEQKEDSKPHKKELAA